MMDGDQEQRAQAGQLRLHAWDVCLEILQVRQGFAP
jgi:hypothetical protein